MLSKRGNVVSQASDADGARPMVIERDWSMSRKAMVNKEAELLVIGKEIVSILKAICLVVVSVLFVLVLILFVHLIK